MARTGRSRELRVVTSLILSTITASILIITVIIVPVMSMMSMMSLTGASLQISLSKCVASRPLLFELLDSLSSCLDPVLVHTGEFIPPSLISMASVSASEVESGILVTLNESGVIPDSYEYALQLGIDHQVLIGVIKSLLVDR